MYIYLTQNLVNGKIYIGQSTKDSEKSKNYLGSGARIKKAIQKYSKSNFVKIILRDNIECRISLGHYEKFYISLFNSTDSSFGYNIQSGGISQDYKIRKKDKDRYKKHSIFLSNLKRTDKWKNNISRSLRGKKLTELRKQNISNAKRGKPVVNKTKYFEIYNEKDEVIYKINGYFLDFCKKKDLPSSVLSKSIQNNGSPIYTNVSLKGIKKKYRQYKGWYAKSFNKDLI